MKRFVLAAMAVAAVVSVAPASAREGCGRGEHRNFRGACVANRGVVLVEGRFYAGHGYWHGGRYWGHRVRWHNGWRYR